MVVHSRYNTSSDEDIVLPNKLGITDQDTLDDHEGVLIIDAYKYFFDLFSNHKRTIEPPVLFEIHSYLFGDLYTWAGKFRTVDISKNGMMFCSSNYLQQSFKEFETLFKKNVPTGSDSKSVVAEKIAVIHCELNAIHPFREGNGRTIRLFLDLIVYVIGYQPIDWGLSTQKEYLNACVKGMKQNYAPMRHIVARGLKK